MKLLFLLAGALVGRQTSAMAIAAEGPTSTFSLAPPANPSDIPKFSEIPLSLVPGLTISHGLAATSLAAPTAPSRASNGMAFKDPGVALGRYGPAVVSLVHPAAPSDTLGDNEARVKVLPPHTIISGRPRYPSNLPPSIEIYDREVNDDDDAIVCLIPGGCDSNAVEAPEPTIFTTNAATSADFQPTTLATSTLKSD
ncbi:unnamed protein product [Periconia digitata]|uniref:Uncharacterized protein n=1 Tax=Periconia digitata TaxID=1303443 RepID=A0A9W4U929_9PLEO|nr:unnamed protein product [Periconia digitata]